MFLNGLIEMAELEATVTGLKARKAEIEAKLATVDTPAVVIPHPGVAEAYAELSERLFEAIQGEEGEAVRNELRKLIVRVDFTPEEGLGKFGLRVHGELARLLTISAAKKQNPRAGKDSGVLVGAGTGFEPVTFRL